MKDGAHGTVQRVDRRDEAASRCWPAAFRNAYDHAFNLDGELFTFDSDMEWDISMPWYREIRTVHGVPGGNYGYRNGSGKLPAWASSTACRRCATSAADRRSASSSISTRVYPTALHDALLEADWSRGRLL